MTEEAKAIIRRTLEEIACGARTLDPATELDIALTSHGYIADRASSASGYSLGSPMEAHRCPICDRRFSDERALVSHATRTRAHETIIEYAWKLRFLLADAEQAKEVYREQRDEWRSLAQELRKGR